LLLCPTRDAATQVTVFKRTTGVAPAQWVMFVAQKEEMGLCTSDGAPVVGDARLSGGDGMQAVRATPASVDDELAELRDARRRALAEHAFTAEAARARLQRLQDINVDAAAQSARGRALLRSLVDIDDERRKQDDHDVAQRQRADIAIQRALGRLRELDSSAEMSRRAPGELREACGFTRVMISSARGSRWMPDTLRRSDHADPDSAEFARFAKDDNEIPLARLMPETEMVRHRVPVIVPEIGAHAYQPLMAVTKSTSYVAAPIVTTRRVIGFFHADRFGQTNDVTQGDLDSIALFAAEFGVLFEHATLADRVRQQRAKWTSTLLSAIERLDAQTIALRPAALAVPVQDETQRPAEIGMATGVPGRALTDRERQVVNLLASGATNRVIAQELVLSVNTVKTHVRNVMKKLHAASRADAVAKYLQLRLRQGGLA
jgi:DNA-binding CsgD family transcriptional regulator